MKESKILTRTYLIPYVGNLDLTLKCLIDNERVNKWGLVKCDSHLLKDSILFVLVFEREYNPYIVKTDIIYDEFEERVKSDDYDNIPNYITDKIYGAISNSSLSISKKDITYVKHYDYSKFIEENNIKIEQPSIITDFIVARIIIRNMSQIKDIFNYAFYRELSKWTDSRYYVSSNMKDTEAIITVIVFKQPLDCDYSEMSYHPLAQHLPKTKYNK